MDIYQSLVRSCARLQIHVNMHLLDEGGRLNYWARIYVIPSKMVLRMTEATERQNDDMSTIESERERES